jgi:hypothetical protein
LLGEKLVLGCALEPLMGDELGLISDQCLEVLGKLGKTGHVLGEALGQS